MKEFLEFVISRLVDYPNEVVITETERERLFVFRVELNPSDVGKIIGRQGQTIQALRNLLNAAACRHDKKAVIEIVEDPRA